MPSRRSRITDENRGTVAYGKPEHTSGPAKLISVPVLDGLHHRYVRVAAWEQPEGHHIADGSGEALSAVPTPCNRAEVAAIRQLITIATVADEAPGNIASSNRMGPVS